MTASDFENAMIKVVKEFAAENSNNVEISSEWLYEFLYHVEDISLDDYIR